MYIYIYGIPPPGPRPGHIVNKRWTKARIRNKPGTNRCIFFFDIKTYTVKHCIYYIKLQMSCQYYCRIWKKERIFHEKQNIWNGCTKHPTKQKEKKAHILIPKKKYTPYQKKCLQLFLNCGHSKNMESRTQLNIRKTKFTTWRIQQALAIKRCKNTKTKQTN